jgi:hypothetical protein
MLYSKMSLSASVWINDTPGSTVRRTLKQPPVRTLEGAATQGFTAYTPGSAGPVADPAQPVHAPADTRVSAMLAKLAATSAAPADDSGLADFRTVPMPPLQPVPPLPQTRAPSTQISGAIAGAQPHFSNYARSYDSPPQRTGVRTAEVADPQAWMMDKISYLVHLAEQQHRAPTRYIAEEFVLYLLLGVFVIFVVDGFARSGVYRR